MSWTRKGFMPHTPCGLAHRGKSLGQHGIEILAVIVAVLELGCLGAQLRIGKSLHLRLERLYLIDDGVYFFKLMIGMAAENFTEETHIICLSYVKIISRIDFNT